MSLLMLLGTVYLLDNFRWRISTGSVQYGSLMLYRGLPSVSTLAYAVTICSGNFSCRLTFYSLEYEFNRFGRYKTILFTKTLGIPMYVVFLVYLWQKLLFLPLY